MKNGTQKITAKVSEKNRIMKEEYPLELAFDSYNSYYKEESEGYNSNEQS